MKARRSVSANVPDARRRREQTTPQHVNEPQQEEQSYGALHVMLTDAQRAYRKRPS